MAGVTLRLPYDTTPDSTSPNYVLSCLDCHEPHGTVLYNVMSGGAGAGLYYSSLLREEMKGEQVECRIDVSSLCGWPQDDADWTPYVLCLRYHAVSRHCGGPTNCLTCHYHGSTVNAGCDALDASINKAF